MQCQHKYTGLDICATPCDGKDDLCIDDADEQDCSAATLYHLIVILTTFIFHLALVGFAKLLHIASHVRAFYGHLVWQKGPKKKFADLKDTLSLPVAVLESERARLRFGIRHATALTRAHLLKMQHLFQCDKTVLRTVYFNRVGSSSEMEDFLDDLERPSVFRRARLRIERSRIGPLLKRRDIQVIEIYSKMAFSVLPYYADMIKDVMIAQQFHAKVIGPVTFNFEVLTNQTYPIGIFFAMVAGLALAEVLNAVKVLTASNFESILGVRKWIGSLLLCPLVPGLISYRIAKESIKLTDTAAHGSNRQLLLIQDRLHALKRLGADLRMNETVTEHFVLTTLLLVLIFTESSYSRTVQTTGNFLVSDDHIWLLAALLTSVRGLVWGHIRHLQAAKRGHLPFIGKFVILPAYYIVGCLARCTAVVLFLTPILGMFGTLELGRFGSMDASAYVKTDFDGRRFLSFKEEWRAFKYDTIGDILDNSGIYFAYASVLPALLLIRLTSLSVLKCSELFNPLHSAWHLLHATICPPLYNDWEDLYRTSKTKIECYKQSMLYIGGHICLTALENSLMCAPLVILKGIVERRVDILESALFPLLPEEERSVLIVNSLLYCGIGSFLLVVPIVQLSLANLYFRHGHAWSDMLPGKQK